jgi:glycosidase
MVFTMGLYSRDIGRWPWQWSATEWHNWLTFTRGETRAAGEGISREAKEKTASAWKWVGKNTQTLYDQSLALLERLGPGEGAAPADSATAGVPTAGTLDLPPDPLSRRSDNYRYGKEWLRKGIDEWRVSLIHPGAAERARSHFRKAIQSFQAAARELGDTEAVHEWLRAAEDYLSDTDERLELIHRSGTG